jgi:hypothetical protein|tara:strand:- start:74 stop:259 length:186 start_codon:yes stop_codon:yes gene_type:complete
MNDDIQYLKGPRYIDGVNIDADIVAAHPKVIVRQIDDPVNDGSLGQPAYAPGSRNLDGSPL